MEKLRTLGICFALSAAIWLLYPSRQLSRPRGGDNVVEISYMGPAGPIQGAMADAVREFERRSELAHRSDPSQPIYRVNSCQTAARDFVGDPTRFLISIAGDLPPDVLYFDRFAIAEWAARGAFMPLDDLIAKDLAAGRPDTPRREDFYPPVWDEAIYAGKVYGIPCSVGDRGVFYNVDLLIRAGYVDEQGRAVPPRTWEQLLEYAKKLCEFDESGRLVRAGFVPDFGNAFLYQYGFANDAHFISDDGRRVTLNSPQVVEALQFMRDLADAQGGYDKLIAFKASFQNDALDPLYVGKLAMKLDGVFALQNIAIYARDLNFGVVPLPRPQAIVDAGGGPVSFIGGWAYAIPANARKKQAAWEFIRFMSSPAAIRIQMESNRIAVESQGQPFIPEQQPMPAMNDWAYQTYMANNPELPQRFKDATRLFNDLLPTSRLRPVTPIGQLLWNLHLSASESALYGAQSPQAALDERNAVAQRALDRFNEPQQGVAIASWRWFFVLYAILLLLLIATAVLMHKRQYPRGSLTRRQWSGGLLCASPWLVGFVIFGGGPLLFSLAISFCDYDIFNPPAFVGLKNYRSMLGDDPLLIASLWNTLYMVIAVPLQMAASLLIAILLNQTIRAIALWRTIFYLPAIVPMIASAVLWLWLLNPQGGLINLALHTVGIDGPSWLQSVYWSKPALLLMRLWACGGGMIIWLAGLKSIPASLYEAAEVDGATSWQQFWNITIPQLTPYIFFNLIMGLIGTFQIFGEALVMTQGGPVNSTLFYVYHLFNHAFRYGSMGYASAMAWLLFAVVLGLTIIQLRASRRWVHYESD